MNQPPQPPQPPSQPPQAQPPQPQQAQPHPTAPAYGPPQAPPQQPPTGPGVPPQAPPGQVPPGRMPMQPGWQGAPGQHPGFPGGQPYPGQAGQPQPRGGNPVGAFLLGLLASFVVATVYSVFTMATIEGMAYGTVNALLVGHGLLNGAIVGWLVGLVGRRSTDARIGGAIVAALGAFFGFTNGIALLAAGSRGFWGLVDLVIYTPLYPVETWWGADALGHLLSVLSLLIAAGAAWGVAYAVGKKQG